MSRVLGIGHKPDSSSHVGNKVLPITDIAAQAHEPSSSASESDQLCRISEKKKKEKTKGEKMKTILRMKELLKWAAAAKAEKGGRYLGRKVLYFRKKSAALKGDEAVSNESPKISFRWDVESCSTTSSVYSAISAAAASNPLSSRVARPGNWITTDSEFVVLEL